MSALQTCPGATVAVALCRFEDMPVGIGVAFDIGERSIALFRTRSGTIHALDNRCPHKGGPLADGIVAGSYLACPLHAQRYRLSDGECESQTQCRVATYPTTMTDGWVHVEVPR
jgi:nitrite reductase (NADH) small subunit